MKIVSKFHDYYDGASWYDSDPKCVYIRHTEEMKRHESPVKISFPIRVEDVARYAYGKLADKKIEVEEQGFIFFCGSCVPYIKFMIHYIAKREYIDNRGNARVERIHKTKARFCYNGKEVTALYKKHGNRHDKNFLKSRPGGLFMSRKAPKKYNRGMHMADFLADRPFNRRQILNWHFEFGSPCFMVTKATHKILNEHGDRIVVNPVLKDLEFYKVYDPPQAFQELEMFIGGVFGQQAPPMVEIPDKIRLEERGFDSKWSFRKEKGD